MVYKQLTFNDSLFLEGQDGSMFNSHNLSIVSEARNAQVTIAENPQMKTKKHEYLILT